MSRADPCRRVPGIAKRKELDKPIPPLVSTKFDFAFLTDNFHITRQSRGERDSPWYSLQRGGTRPVIFGITATYHRQFPSLRIVWRCLRRSFNRSWQFDLRTNLCKARQDDDIPGAFGEAEKKIPALVPLLGVVPVAVENSTASKWCRPKMKKNDPHARIVSLEDSNLQVVIDGASSPGRSIKSYRFASIALRALFCIVSHRDLRSRGIHRNILF